MGKMLQVSRQIRSSLMVGDCTASLVNHLEGHLAEKSGQQVQEVETATWVRPTGWGPKKEKGWNRYQE